MAKIPACYAPNLDTSSLKKNGESYNFALLAINLDTPINSYFAGAHLCACRYDVKGVSHAFTTQSRLLNPSVHNCFSCFYQF